jgi:TPR repeat protein
MSGRSPLKPPYEAALAKAQDGDARLPEVASLLTRAHQSGDVRATYALATWYLHGRFFKKDMRKSVALLRKAANHNIPDALFDLAVCYEKGAGVPVNEPKAVELYLRAALHGEAQSVYEVGRCYYYGIGVQQNRRIARVWQDRAKELGVTDEVPELQRLK